MSKLQLNHHQDYIFKACAVLQTASEVGQRAKMKLEKI